MSVVDVVALGESAGAAARIRDAQVLPDVLMANHLEVRDVLDALTR